MSIVNLVEVILSRLFARGDYFIYTHSKGWIHCSRATEQDFKERSGFMPAYVRIKD